MSPSNFRLILDAFDHYTSQVGMDLMKNPLADALRRCDSPNAVLELLQDKAHAFNDYRDGDRALIDWLKPVVQVVHGFSGVLGEAVSLVPFPPASAVLVSVEVLLTAASDVSSSYDSLVDLFECLGNFLKRLQIYTSIPLTPSMTDIIVKILVELLSVLALATKQVQQEKFGKKLLGEREIEAVLQKLDRLTQEEARVMAAQTLEVVHCLVNNVKVVMDDGRASLDGVRNILVTMQGIASDINKMKRDQLQKDARNWISPPDPSKNYNIACEAYQTGTAIWFLQGGVFAEWNAKATLLWIHGKPGSGKSILLSAIIQDIEGLCAAGLALMAYFYFDFRDTDKQHRRGLLSSLLCQLCAESDSCYKILSRLYSSHAAGTREPSDSALTRCLMDMLRLEGQPTIYIIVDALDECPNTSGMPTPREKVLEFVENLIESQLPNVHICISSRPEFDIRNVLEPLASFRVSLHDESGQKRDILDYVSTVIHSDRRMRKWRGQEKQLVIDALTERADGMFRWVFCQLETLRHSFPGAIRHTLDELPETLDETYEQILLSIEKAKRNSAYRLFQCLTVAIRPLRVDELAEVLALRFDPGHPAEYRPDWRPEDSHEAVLSACSSLVTVVDVDGSPVVQFSHFSVKEFLTSERLATARPELSRYHILPHLAHTLLARASLSVLLQLDAASTRTASRIFHSLSMPPGIGLTIASSGMCQAFNNGPLVLQ
ncbi:hypothetical protein EDB86DRAFT_3084585 [Lactarius hatsudake]|nr:hypothetical protein EDB86DRAFT_3084585 [Lactarius hatsudake]